MTIQEILKARGLDETAIEAILADMKASKLYLSGEENIDIRYGKLKTQHESTTSQLTEAQALIETMKKATKGQEDLQGKIAAYETREKELLAELEQTKVLSEVKFALKDAGALDVDYLVYTLQKDGELTLDENGKVKGIEDKLAGLKTRMPGQFESKGGRKVIENKLPDRGDEGGGNVTKEDFNKMGYNSRVELKQNNPELYSKLTKPN